jgi:hypothetical protein
LADKLIVRNHGGVPIGELHCNIPDKRLILDRVVCCVKFEPPASAGLTGCSVRFANRSYMVCVNVNWFCKGSMQAGTVASESATRENDP